MRRIWNLFGDGKQQPQGTREEGSGEDEDAVEVTNTGTQTTLSKEEIKEDAGTPVRDDRSVDEGGKRKSKKKKKKISKSSEARTPKKSTGSIGKRKRSKEVVKEKDKSKESEKRDEEGAKHSVIAEAREIAAREDNESFENDGGTLAKSKIKTRDLKWKEEQSSSEERKKKATTPVKKITEARDENKADDEEFENDGKGAMAKSKIKTRDLKWKGSEESPTKTERTERTERTVEDRSQGKTHRKRHSDKVAEARDENKADDEEFENDGKGAMAKSKIKTRDLKWKSNEPTGEASPGKKTSGSDSGEESTEHKKPKRKHTPVKQKVAEARDENKADDEEFENDGASMARSKIKTRDLKWKEEEKETPKKPVMAEARDENKADDEEFENDGKSMARSKIKTRDLKWKKEEETPPPTRRVKSVDSVDSSEARSPIKIVEARDVNKADDEEFENDGASMARSKIKSRDLQWKKEEASPAKSSGSQEKMSASAARKHKTPEKKETKTVDTHKSSSESPDPPPRSFMQMLLPDKKKEPVTDRSSMMLPPSPALSSPHQTSVMKEVKETTDKVDKSSATRSRHSLKKDDNSRESIDKSFMKNLRPRLSLNRKSKNRSAEKSVGREHSKKEDKSHSESTSSQMSQPSPDKSSRERTSSTRLDVAANAVDKSMRSIKSMFKKTDDTTKKRMEDLLPHVERDARDVQDARRLMEMLKRNNVLENALFPYQNETLRAHFTSGSRKLDKNTMDLLFKATDFVLDKILYRGEELDEYIDNPLKTFILNRTKSRTMVVEHLLKHPEFLPQTWGGRTVVLMRSEEEVTVAPEDEKSKKDVRSKREERKK